MTGLKSGSGDDLWGDDGDDEEDHDAQDADTSDSAADESASETGNDRTPDETSEPLDRTDVESGEAVDSESAKEPPSDPSPATTSEASTDQSTTSAADAESTLDASSIDIGSSSSDAQPYIVRRAVQDKSVQFERDERLTFFVHDDVADGERDLLTDLESALGRDLPKFDVREAVYRAALRNPEAVLEELLAMGYSVDEE